MEELLNALKEGDVTRVNELAKELLVTRDNKLNKIEVDAFEHFARCKVEEWPEATIFKSRCYIGIIIYRNKTFAFG